MTDSTSERKDSSHGTLSILKSESSRMLPNCDLGFIELNSHQQTSIILLHGALSSPLDFGLVIPHLQDYHIIMPALHSDLRQVSPRSPFKIAALCAQLATIVTSKAKQGVVHVFGFSMGAYIALNFAMMHPELVLKLVISGISMSSQSSWWKKAALAPVLYGQSLPPKYLLSRQKHTQILNKAIRPASHEFMSEYIQQLPDGDWTLCKEIAAELSRAIPEHEALTIVPRTLVIAATASPGDSIDAARSIVQRIRKAGGGARGIEIKNGSHPWLLQLPELCAEVLKTWFEAAQVPSNVTIIETGN